MNLNPFSSKTVDSIIKPVTDAIQQLRALAEQKTVAIRRIDDQINELHVEQDAALAERARALKVAAVLTEQFGVSE